MKLVHKVVGLSFISSVTVYYKHIWYGLKFLRHTVSTLEILVLFAALLSRWDFNKDLHLRNQYVFLCRFIVIDERSAAVSISINHVRECSNGDCIHKWPEMFSPESQECTHNNSSHGAPRIGQHTFGNSSRFLAQLFFRCAVRTHLHSEITKIVRTGGGFSM